MLALLLASQMGGTQEDMNVCFSRIYKNKVSAFENDFNVTSIPAGSTMVNGVPESFEDARNFLFGDHCEKSSKLYLTTELCSECQATAFKSYTDWNTGYVSTAGLLIGLCVFRDFALFLFAPRQRMMDIPLLVAFIVFFCVAAVHNRRVFEGWTCEDNKKYGECNMSMDSWYPVKKYELVSAVLLLQFADVFFGLCLSLAPRSIAKYCFYRPFLSVVDPDDEEYLEGNGNRTELGSNLRDIKDRNKRPARDKV
jgi:hypothetical protein